MLLDALQEQRNRHVDLSWSVTSPTYDLGTERTGVIAILNVPGLGRALRRQA